MLAAVRVAAIVETVTYVVLCAAVVVRVSSGPNGVPMLGPVHGVVFLAYAALVLANREALGWDSERTARALSAAIVPLGCLVVERRWLRGRGPLGEPLR